jgi:uncharacterized membrane protein YccC
VALVVAGLKLRQPWLRVAVLAAVVGFVTRFGLLIVN